MMRCMRWLASVILLVIFASIKLHAFAPGGRTTTVPSKRCFSCSRTVPKSRSIGLCIAHKDRKYGIQSVMERKQYSTGVTTMALGADDFLADISPGAVAGVALLLFVAAQTFINSMLTGDQGLGAFLTDGKGFQKSGFKPRNKSNSRKEDAPLANADPLPWLKLPRFDFVEVAGQKDIIDEQMEISASTASQSLKTIGGVEVTGVPQQDEQVQLKLESLRKELRAYLNRGDIERAEAVKEQLEDLMKKYGFEYRPGQ